MRFAAAQAKQSLEAMQNQNETLMVEMKQLTHQKAELRGQLDEVLDRVRRAGDE